jgi:chromosome segregation ATPase
MVLKLISWRHSFNKLNEEYTMAKKKKQALDNLLDSGRISQSTYEQIDKEIEESIAEVERQQETLLEKMNSKIAELESQIKMLEMLLANSEIQHVTGDVDEEVYQRESSLLSTGLETARQELSLLKDAANQLSNGIQPLADEISKIEAKIVDLKESKSSDTSPAESEPTESETKAEEKQGN